MTYPYTPTGVYIPVKSRMTATRWMATYRTFDWRELLRANDALICINKLQLGQEANIHADASTLRCLDASFTRTYKGKRMFSVVWLNDVAVVTRTV